MISILRCVLAAVILSASQLQAQDLGPVTNLPLPRFVSLKASEANIRRGPSLSHRIDWIYQHRNMPLMIIAEYGNWRRVVDRDGLGGWVHYVMLSGTRTVIIDAEIQPLFTRADYNSPQQALLERGVIAWIDACNIEWCRLHTNGHKGWAPKSALWGVEPTETFD